MQQNTVAGKHTLQVEPRHHQIVINGQAVQLDVQAQTRRRFHVLTHEQSHNVEVAKFDPDTKTYQVIINGKHCEVSIKDRFDILLEQLGMHAGAGNQIKDLKAPMPGQVLKVLVQPGQTVQKDEPLLILEAMKMENVLKATAEAQVKAIKVNQGDNVEKNHVLIAFEAGS